jgi:hypothetical protein
MYIKSFCDNTLIHSGFQFYLIATACESLIDDQYHFPNVVILSQSLQVVPLLVGTSKLYCTSTAWTTLHHILHSIHVGALIYCVCLHF